MGVPRRPETSEEERKKLYDPKPLKFYRPSLSSDPRSLIEKVSHISLEERPHNRLTTGRPRDVSRNDSVSRRSNRSSSVSSLNRNSTQLAQDRFHKRSSFTTLPQRNAFRVIDGNNHITSREQSSLGYESSLSFQQRQSSDYQNSKDDFKQKIFSTACNSDPKLEVRTLPSDFFQGTGGRDSHQNGIQVRGKTSSHSSASVTTDVRRTVRGPKPSQNWRLAPVSGEEQDSCVESSMDTSVLTSSTPLPPSDLSVLSDQTELSRNEALHNSSNSSRPSCRSSDAQSYDDLNLDTDLSFDQSSVSTLDDIQCLNPDDPVPQPILLLPVPEHLRRYTPLVKMDRSTSSADSGVDALSVTEGKDELSSRLHHNDIPLPKQIRETSCTSATNDLNSSRKSEDADSAFDTTEDGYFNKSCRSSSSDKVLMESLSSFSSSPADKPVKSQSSFKESKTACRPASLRSFVNDNSKAAMSSMGLPSSFGTPTATKRKSTDFPKTDPDLQEQERVCFSKKFKFAAVDWKLPDPVELFSSKSWQLGNFLELKQKLNSVKDELNDLPLQDWHSHTKRRNKAGNIIWQLRKKIDPELPTQAWCKFYENVSRFPLVPHKAIEKKTLRSVHLCEAPGAFITSLNHFLCVNHGSDFDFDWRAVTLNPYHEGNPLSCMINDDRLILTTLDKWMFGCDNTGDLMNKENLMNMIEEASKLGEVLLVTADGSIDCQDNPAEQEEIVSWLHFCETVAALQMLAPGGSLLIKMFTFYEHLSICVLYLLNCVFESVVVNKPVTSKEGNSEVYVVCCGYLGSHAFQPWLNILMSKYGPKSPESALFPLSSIPKSFLDQLYRCADFFRKLQTDVIKDNIRSYHFPAKRDNYLAVTIRHRVADTFFRRCNLQKLDRALYLVGKDKIENVTTPNIDSKYEEGSFNDRRKRMTLSPEEELKCIKDDIRYMDIMWPGDFDVFWLDFPENPQGFKIVRGKPITKVNSSKFCLGRLLKLRNRVREIAHSHFKVDAAQRTSQCDTRVLSWPENTDFSPKRKVTILNFEQKLWSSLEDGSNDVNEKNACREILSAIEHKVFRDDCLELRGYPLLTQFNVGVVYLLGHLFEKVGFVRPLGQDIRVLFFNYRKFNPEMKRHWDEVVAVMDHDSETVLSVIEISELSDGDFYKYVTEINNLCVVEQIQDFLSAMSVES